MMREQFDLTTVHHAEQTLIVLGYTLIPFATLFEAGSLSIGSFVQQLPTIAE